MVLRKRRRIPPSGDTARALQPRNLGSATPRHPGRLARLRHSPMDCHSHLSPRLPHIPQVPGGARPFQRRRIHCKPDALASLHLGTCCVGVNGSAVPAFCVEVEVALLPGICIRRVHDILGLHLTFHHRPAQRHQGNSLSVSHPEGDQTRRDDSGCRVGHVDGHIHDNRVQQ